MSARGEGEMMIGEGEKAGRGDVEGERLCYTISDNDTI